MNFWLSHRCWSWRTEFVLRSNGHGQRYVSHFLYYACLEKVYQASLSIYDSSTEKAVAQEKELIESINLTVSSDGTWKKRGFSSLFGAASLIGKHTRKVLDSIVKSKLCQACSAKENSKHKDPDTYEWYESHSHSIRIVLKAKIVGARGGRQRPRVPCIVFITIIHPYPRNSKQQFRFFNVFFINATIFNLQVDKQ